MKKAIVVLTGLALALGVSVAAQSKKGQPKAAAGAPEAIIYDAASAMAFLTTTAGQWLPQGAAQHEHGAVAAAPSPNAGVLVETKAARSAVVHTYNAGRPDEMETVFHMDGDKLLLTHYCALQNAPILKFVKSDKPGELKFVFEGGTNFDPAIDAHLHNSTFQIIDKNTIEQRSQVFTNGKASEAERKSVLHRHVSTN